MTEDIDITSASNRKNAKEEHLRTHNSEKFWSFLKQLGPQCIRNNSVPWKITKTDTVAP